jgi:hypothetical protein
MGGFGFVVKPIYAKVMATSMKKQYEEVVD